MTILNMAESQKRSVDYAALDGAKATVPTRRFRPRLLPTLAAALLVPLFISFGQWQWHKASVKGDLRALLDARSAEPAVLMPGSPVDAPTLRYRKVIVRGHYEPQRQILIDNRIYRDEAGYHVVTPLRIEGSEMRVLVNRGWVPALAEHSQHPHIATPAGPVEVAGMAVVPSGRFFTLGADAPPGQSAWSEVWQNLDLARYGRSVEFPVQPVVVQLDADSNAGGFAREWPRPDERIEQHLSYALQWWGFAATTVAIWLFVNFRRNRTS